jgi:hypothetical protein
MKMPGQMHVSGRKKDTVSPALIDTSAANRMTVVDEDLHFGCVQ